MIMIIQASAMNGYSIQASDGKIGTVSDLLFDDDTWLVRWLVVDVGDWLLGRKVLLPSTALGHLDKAEQKFSVRLSRHQVKNSPDIDTSLPVSRHMETDIYDYYGWRPYWPNGLYLGGFGYPADSFASTPDSVDGPGGLAPIDRHLRSAHEIKGYHIHATDGEIGHVDDLLIEDGDWSIHYLSVETSNWWLGKEVLISPRSVQDIDWQERRISLDVDRARVKGSPPYAPTTQLDRIYENQFHDYYGDGRALSRR
jgi:sporulation protein YlmC with PRC-barrel domain